MWRTSIADKYEELSCTGRQKPMKYTEGGSLSAEKS